MCCRPGHTGFNTAERRLWRDDMFGSQVLGYVKTHKHLTQVIIRNAGHMVGGTHWSCTQLINTNTVACQDKACMCFCPPLALYYHKALYI
jgi:hypothetical protein